MKKKVLLVTLLVVAIVASCFAFTACNKDKDKGNKGPAKVEMSGYNPATDGPMKVAMITDYGDITDQSFNQTTYEASKAFCEANGLTFKYYKPAGDATEARVASVEQAIQEGFNVIVMPGYAFGETVVEVAEQNEKVTFVALDVSQGDLGADYTIPGNVATFVYREEISGFMAGYAAVKEGYKNLGFVGGMAVPAVIRFGYGYVQGVNAAAVELGIANEVTVNYRYGGKFNGTPEITAAMDTWYENGTEVVFACGGGIFTSACEAAKKVHGKVIGVDSDQSYVINKYEDGMCVTSAMKGLAPTVNTVLKAIKDGNWKDYYGTVSNLGMVSGTDASLNYVQLPTATWSMKNFTKEDYATLVGKIFDGTITISDAIDKMPATTIKVTTQDNIH